MPSGYFGDIENTKFAISFHSLIKFLCEDLFIKGIYRSQAIN